MTSDPGLFEVPPRLPDHSNPDDYLNELERRIRSLPPRTEFVTAQLATDMHRTGWKPLAEGRAIGALIVRLATEGWIRKTGHTTTTARSHSGIATTWRRTVKQATTAA